LFVMLLSNLIVPQGRARKIRLIILQRKDSRSN
jgi:hypothetical protein